MNLKSFFWQVFFALAILCIGSIALFYSLNDVMSSPRLAVYVTMLPTLAVGFFMAYRLSRPLEALRHHLKKMAEGDITLQALSLRTDVIEIHELAAAMEKIRDQLQQRIHTILGQKNEQDALLASMVEGVIAIDDKYQILHMNQAAAYMLSAQSGNIVGKSIHEIVRVTEVLDTVEECLTETKMLERDIQIAGQRTKYLQLHASPMRMADSERFGVVLVFSDVTRLRELEGMRRNFVSNVSHELRTPLTSIQGFAETLLNPAVKDPAEIKKFLEIIQRHAARLGRIIEDILALSRIERDAESNQIDLKKGDINPILSAAVELCQIKAQKRGIKLHLHCSEGLTAMMDPYLLEQAIVNLIDNAIRYSDEGKEVRISAEQDRENVKISVADQGVGIAEKQIPRIFERFYRVDKARSREMGGTGLGLSIVKHISLAHHGRVEVKSEVGRGSVFTIYLPLSKE